MTTAAPYTAVGDKLKATSGVSTLVGTWKSEASIFARRAPEGIRQPATTGGNFSSYIVIRKTQGEAVNHLTNRLDKFRISPMGIYCFAATHTLASSLADAVLTAIDSDATAQTGTQTWGTFSVDRCELIDRYDASTDPSMGDEIDFYCEAIEIKLYHVC